MAVLGILAINIAGFAGPPAAVYSPSALTPASPLDSATFAFALVVFEGKMRALFAILFGASMELFLRRAERAGREAEALQLRRLLWLAVFGYLHFLLLWWGDILFSYAFAGCLALALRQMPRRALLAVAVLVFSWWQLDGIPQRLELASLEARVMAGSATSAEVTELAEARAGVERRATHDLASVRQGFAEQITDKVRERPLTPLWNAWFALGEVLPYMLVGMVLLKGGFFSGQWSHARFTGVFWAAGAGLCITTIFVGWAWAHGYPFAAMRLAIDHALGFPHLFMALGYAAMLVRLADPILATWMGARIAAAGRMAFSNYLGTTLAMTAVFHGWGLGLAGTVGTAAQGGFVLLGWALMLSASWFWLARFRQGPLEWAWRSLVEKRALALRR